LLDELVLIFGSEGVLLLGVEVLLLSEPKIVLKSFPTLRRGAVLLDLFVLLELS
jgi:hypothetical protein